MGVEIVARRPSSHRRDGYGKLWAAAAATMTLLAPLTLAHADEPTLPVQVQAGLLAKVAAYDRNLVGLEVGKVVVAIVTRKENLDSTSAGARLQAGLQGIPLIAGLSHEEMMVSFTTANALADLCRKNNVSIAYLAPGLDREIPAVAEAMRNMRVLTAGAMTEYVSEGIVLGFDLVSGRPKILVHLEQARKQNVVLTAQLLKLAVIVE